VTDVFADGETPVTKGLATLVVISLNVMCCLCRAHQVKGEKMKYSLLTLIMSISIAVSPVARAKEQIVHTEATTKKNVLTKHETQSNTKPVHNVAKHKSKHRHRKHHTFAPVDPLNGIASWYGYESGPRYRRRPKTASGEYFSPQQFTAAHKSLPFGTMVTVTNLENHKSVIVKINDRGPFVFNRIIDLSKAAARAIGITGIQKVKLTVVS